MKEKELKKKQLEEEKNKKEPDIVTLMKEDLLAPASEAILDPVMTNDSITYNKERREVKTMVETVNNEYNGVGRVEINIDDKSPNKIKQIQKELLKNIREVDNEITELKILQETTDNKGRLKFAYAKLELLKERTNCLEILYKIINDNPDVLDDSGFKDMIDFISQTRGQ